MGQGTLTIYSASAGSGKTFNLARSYLSRLFRSKYSYRKILAVTFTNKATAEMKGRILDQLYILSAGGKSEYISEIIKVTGKEERVIRKEAGEILFLILHDFSRFSVSTIDTFFQKIIRAFMREAGLHSGFNIELDHSIILSAAVDEMIASAEDDPKLKKWLSEFVMDNLREEKSWNLKAEILTLAEELFKEKFRILPGEDRSNLNDKDSLVIYIRDMHAITSSFETKMASLGQECLKLFGKYDLSDDMFYQKSKGIPSFVRSLADGKIIKPGDKVREIENDPPRWATKEPDPRLTAAIKGGLEGCLKESIRLYDSGSEAYFTALCVLSNIYTLGILSDISGKVRQITSRENKFLLSDSGELIRLITEGDQTPFIYEKTGSSYENFMIDEFQDTSLLQWINFKPLISESMDNGHDNLIVGDVKQSIYRFRNSDWRILAEINGMIDGRRYLSNPLRVNFRSMPLIIKFNNSLFSVIPEQLGKEFTGETVVSDFSKLYSEAVQEDPGKKTGGYVRIEFTDDEKDDQDGSGDGRKSRVILKWEDKVLEKLPGIIEAVQDKGYSASDIGIIVREGKEGQRVLSRIAGYSAACPAEKKQKYNYNIVSGDSLSVASSNAVSFIIAALKVIVTPSDTVSRASMVRNYLLAGSAEEAEKADISADQLLEGSPGILPEGSNAFLDRAGKMPLFEAVESIISFYGLGNNSSGVAYLSTFQDMVMTYSGGTDTSAEEFLDWWETTGYKKTVALPAGQDAVRVLTIHKSKGLEFRVVILPFISWNLDHKNFYQPVIWVRPDRPPFDNLNVLPVRYSRDLENTLFAGSYNEERLSVYIDNLNLLYVAMTRAMDALFGFAPLKPTANEAIAGVLFNAITSDANPAGESGIIMNNMFDRDSGVFEYGSMPQITSGKVSNTDMIVREYRVSPKPESLRLKLHGESYLTTGDSGGTDRIGYGNLMHEVFEAINTKEDVPAIIRRMVFEGRLPEAGSAELTDRIISLVSAPETGKWFSITGEKRKEAGILLPSGMVKRPDRVIIDGDKAVVVDFKFGEKKHEHIYQVSNYKELLSEMGYKNTEGFLWYVDKNEIVTV